MLKYLLKSEKAFIIYFCFLKVDKVVPFVQKRKYISLEGQIKITF